MAIRQRAALTRVRIASLALAASMRMPGKNGSIMRPEIGSGVYDDRLDEPNQYKSTNAAVETSQIRSGPRTDHGASTTGTSANRNIVMIAHGVSQVRRSIQARAPAPCRLQ